MFCQKCNLHYHDHMSFCRRCGQPLARSTSDHAVDSHCCTRCGARVVRGENFCQQCGNRIGVALQDTVIGACYHCGTSWRSGWLFCKNCGLDRKRALLLSTSSPSSTPLFAGAKQNGAEPPLEEFSETAKVNCQFCGAEAKPFSRFCESCGKRIGGGGSGAKPATSVTIVSLQTPHEPPQVKLKPPDDEHVPVPTIFESQPLVESKPPAQSILQAGEPELVKTSTANSSNKISSPIGHSPVIGEWYPPAIIVEVPGKSSGAISQGRLNVEPPHAHVGTVVTPLPAFGRVADELGDSGALKNSRSRNLQWAVLLGLIALFCVIVIWWLVIDRQSVQKPALSAQPAPIAVKPEPVQEPSPVSRTEQAVTVPPAMTVPEGMVFVPGGKFEMGRANGDEYEKPAHMVIVESFFIDRTEVTNEAYQQFVAAMDHPAPPHWSNGKFPESEARLPVVNVSWNDASDYAKWANKRLPTEAEWEFAARGTDGRIYPWGNTWNQSAGNAGRSAGGRVVAAGSFPGGASPFGALDMCGNVWEWTASSLQSYAQSSLEIAPGKVIRGGAFDVSSARATTTYRGVLPIDRLADKTGFRTVREAPKP